MKKSIVVILMIVLLTSCGVKEGFTTFGALQNKIDDYLINLDVSEAEILEFNIQSDDYGLIDAKLYKEEAILFMDIIQVKDLFEKNIEVYYIDESLVYIVEINDINDDVLEYIILDGELAAFNTDDGVLEELESNNIVELIVYIEGQMK